MSCSCHCTPRRQVYRRDQPQMARGRFREFFQCDFDVAGVYPTMVADAEVIKVLVEILTDLQLGSGFEVKLNHRQLLDAMLDIAGVPAQKFRCVCAWCGAARRCSKV